MTPRRGTLATRFGWALAMIALLACFAMIALGIAGLLREQPPARGVTPARTFIPSLEASPPSTLGGDLVVVDPRVGVDEPVATLQGDQWNGERSPDGRRVVFQQRPDADASAQIFVLEADGSVEQLTTLHGGATAPTWSPDGRWIAFTANSEHERDIFVMHPDGSGVRLLAGTPSADSFPDWSPDGSRIVFQSGAPSSIWTVSIPGGRLTRLTFGGDGDTYPIWSPDGARILFLRYERFGGQLEISDSDFFLMRPNGTGKERLLADEGPLPADPLSTYEGWGMTSPDNHFQDTGTWSPDGRRVAYSGGHCHCITIVDVAHGEIVRSIPGEYTNVSWDLDGILANLNGVRSVG